MAESNQEAPFAYEGLDRAFHARARLAIVSSLSGHVGGLGFSDLKSLCGLTDGNLARHLEVLEEAGCVKIEKGHEGKRSYTQCRLTATGRARFSDYLTVLKQVLRKATKATARISGEGRVLGNQRT